MEKIAFLLENFFTNLHNLLLSPSLIDGVTWFDLLVGVLVVRLGLNILASLFNRKEDKA